MSKKNKNPKFGLETILRLGVFTVLIYLAIGYLSSSQSNINIPSLSPQVLGTFSPQINQGQRWLENEVKKLKSQALDQVYDKIKSSLIK